MTMALSTTYTKLQDVHAAVSGVKSAPYDRPAAIQPAQCPCVLTWLGPGTWTNISHNFWQQEREYIVRCYYAPLAQGVWFGNVRDMLTVMQSVIRAYTTDTNINLGGTIDHNLGMSDNGDDGILMYNGVPFVGFEIRVRIREKSSI